MRINQLDGIRAVAILLVFAEHGFGLKMGWAGVDLFFVLSGFLITQILRRDREAQRYWSRFYVKRAVRILPPLILCLVVCAVLFRPKLRILWLAYIGFGANVADAIFPYSNGPLSVLWSLAIEEHFYLLWPIAVRYMERVALIRLLTTLLILEPILRAAVTPFMHSYWPIYYLTPFRLDGLAAGSLLALARESHAATAKIASLSGPLFCVAITISFGCMAIFHSFTRPANSIAFNSVGYTLVTLTAVSLVSFALLHRESLLTKILTLRVAIFLGVTSYSIYLFHLVFLDIVKGSALFENSRLATILGAFALTVLFSWLSFLVYESPFIRWGHKMASRLT